MDDGDDYDYYEEPEPPWARRPRDPKTDEARAALLELFAEAPSRVFYSRQLEVLLEDRFFHWITARAHKELAAERRIGTELVSLLAPLRPGTPPSGPVIRFSWSQRNRYWRRQAEAIRRLVVEFSGTGFGRALGRQAEQMFDAALPRVGFLPVAWDVREYAGKAWIKTEHDFDRVFLRDGIAYGTEIKNTLDYIEPDELAIKLEMCQELGLKPLFVVRMAPKSYVEQVRQAGGFTLIFKFQLHPHGQEDLARRVREGLGLPVDCPAAIAEGTVRRFLKWHLRAHGLAESA